jgi:hypothetical protein
MGKYTAATDNGFMAKPYVVDINVLTLTDEKGHDNALSMLLRTRTLHKMVQKKYEDFDDIHTHEIISVQNMANPDDDTIPYSLMSRRQLTNLIKKKKYPLNPELYGTVSEFRQAMSDYQSDPESFKKAESNRAHMQEKKLQDLKARKEMTALNPELQDEDYDGDLLDDEL